MEIIVCTKCNRVNYRTMKKSSIASAKLCTNRCNVAVKLIVIQLTAQVTKVHPLARVHES